MWFVCDGQVYAAAEMRVFRTADPTTPVVYLTCDGRSTFVVTQDRDGDLAAHRAATGEIIALSHRHHIPELLGAFPSRFAPARIVWGSIADDPEPELRISDAPSIVSGTPRAGVLA